VSWSRLAGPLGPGIASTSPGVEAVAAYAAVQVVGARESREWSAEYWRGGAGTPIPPSRRNSAEVAGLFRRSPYVTNNHQEKNARVLEKAGGACVMLESEVNGPALFQKSCDILHDAARRASMSAAMEALGIPDATERIYRTVLELL